MSTVDPAAVRRERAARPQRWTGPAAGLVLSAVLWGLFGYALADVIRYPVATAYLPAELQPPNVTPGLLWLFFVTVFAGAIANIGLMGGLARRVGAGAANGIELGTSAIAVAAGFAVGAPARWVAPADPGFDGDVGARVAWTAQVWAPVALAAAGLLLVLSAVTAVRRRRKRQARARAVHTTGQRVEGVVTDVADTGVEVMDEPRLSVTVKFTDHHGVDRWVTRRTTFDRARLPRIGDAAVVWFDPANPGDERSIPVALDGDPLTDDGPVPTA